MPEYYSQMDNNKGKEEDYDGKGKFADLLHIDMPMNKSSSKGSVSMIEKIAICKSKNTTYETILNTWKNSGITLSEY